MAYTKQLALSPLNVQTVSYDYEFEDAKVQKNLEYSVKMEKKC